MGFTYADAYAQIKTLENSGLINLPEPQDTVTIGTIDPAKGTFAWGVPTVVQSISDPPPPGGKTNIITTYTVGIVGTKAVDLLLKFVVIPIKIPSKNGPARTASQSAPHLSEKIAINPVIGNLQESNGGTTIAGFPTVSSTATQIVVDAGLVCSTVLQTSPNVLPPVSTFSLMINIPGHPAINILFFILRPPVVGLGAFTIPALPMAIVYAPPQGKEKKNVVTYSDTATLTKTVTTAITTSNSTKTVQAYSAADLIGKVAAAITAVVAVVGTGGAAGGGASVAGALAELGAALFGPAKDKSDSAADSAKQVASELSLVSTALNAVPDPTPSNTDAIQTENDTTLTLTLTQFSQYTADNPFGTGAGDRIVYLKDVKVVWAAVNGEVGIHILGFEGVGANAVRDLQADLQAIAQGQPGLLGLDVATMKSLLALDPLTPSTRTHPLPVPIVSTGPALIGPPRYVPADPSGYNGSGAPSPGDQKQFSVEQTSDERTVTTHTQTTITDVKPSWVGVLFGGSNTETTTTATFTTSHTTDLKTGDKVTSSFTFVSDDRTDSYNVKVFYDCMFGTYLAIDANSPALHGSPVISTH